MKFILPLTISVFITGCTLLPPQKNTTTPTTQVQSETVNEKNEKIFNTQDLSTDVKTEYVYKSLNDTIINIANQLFKTMKNKENEKRVILTSFVDLNELNTTSTFGRLLSESMFNELHIRDFIVTDFRGQEAVTVNEDGEFHISRDVEKLKDTIEAVEYILVGTYVKFENESLLINARILDSISGMVISSARVVYKPIDCSDYNVCRPKEVVNTQKNLFDGTNDSAQNNSNQQINMRARENSTFTIVADDCVGDECSK
ncbi:MAG: FlgO family outer membrane protein [Arcobacteraceae bacterium]